MAAQGGGGPVRPVGARTGTGQRREGKSRIREGLPGKVSFAEKFSSHEGKEGLLVSWDSICRAVE